MVNGFNEVALSKVGLEDPSYANAEDAKNKLKQLILGKQQDAANATRAGLEGVANKKTEEANTADNDIHTMHRLKDEDLSQDGGQMKAGNLSVGVDPYAKLIAGNQKASDSAMMAAQKNYNSGVSKILPVVQAANEGLDAVNDPHNVMKLGQARTLALKAMGMNRYNEAEAKAVLPPALQGTVSQFFNSGGGDEEPLNESQKRSLNTFFSGQVSHAKEAHDVLKSNSLNMYQMSRGYDPTRGQQLQQSLGAPVDANIAGVQSRYKSLPTTTSPVDQRPAPTGMVDKLKAFLSGNQPQQTPAAPANGGQMPTTDAIQAEIARRRGGQ